jgi:hypothetical protein
MKTMAISMTKSTRRSSARDGRNDLRGFCEYTCRNGACVLSRFERFWMAAVAAARCPVCGEAAMPAGDETFGSPN